MKVLSFNINGIRARLHQLAAVIEKHQPDILGLQEIKVHDDQFPLDEVKAMGYEVYHHGQKGHYGVAILSKTPVLEVQKGFPTDDDEAQRRMIMVKITTATGQVVTLLNGYFPQGESQEHATKFPAKRKFYADLLGYLNHFHQPDEAIVIMGDMNISPSDLDIGIGDDNKKRWLRTGKCSFLPEEREWYQRLYDWGLTDSFRHLYPDRTERYSWFDYRSKGFDDNRGLRIDHILATASLQSRLVASEVDYELRAMEKPSDHAPVWAVFDI